MSQIESENKVVSSSDQQIVKPLFCFDVYHVTYFKFFTILMIVTSFLDLLMALIFSFDKFRSVGIMGTLIDLPILVVASVAYSKYNDSNDYGQSLHYCFAMSLMIFTCILLAGSIVIPMIIVLFISSGVFTEILTIKGHNILWLVVTLYLVVIIPLMIYYAYLNYLYLRVVSTKNEENIKNKGTPDTIIFEEPGNEIAELKKPIENSEH